MELGIGGGKRERRDWFEQMFCSARTVKTVPYSAIYNVRQYLLCARCAEEERLLFRPCVSLKYTYPTYPADLLFLLLP